MKKLILLCLLCFGYSFVSKSIIHTIYFGTHYGNNYVPNAMIVNLGDTVLFSGTFGIMPLESTILPTGADSFSNYSGSDFMYIPTVLGTHNYHCSTDSTMSGSFYVQSNVSIAQFGASSISLDYDPASRTIFLKGTDYEPFDAKLYDQIGQLVCSAQKITKLNLLNLNIKNSLYYLEIRKNQFIFTEKIFIY